MGAFTPRLVGGSVSTVPQLAAQLDRVQLSIKSAFDSLKLGGTSNVTTQIGQLTINSGGSGGGMSIGLTPTGVVPGTYPLATVTVDTYGRVTSASAGAATLGTGPLQQSVTGGVATVTAFPLGSTNIPFGSGSGTFAQSNLFTYNSFLSQLDVRNVNVNATLRLTALSGTGLLAFDNLSKEVFVDHTHYLPQGQAWDHVSDGTNTYGASGYNATLAFDPATLTLTLNGGTNAMIGIADTAVTPGSYTNANITVDAKGRITAASNGSSGGGGITALTGEVTASGSGSVAATISASAVTYAKIQNVSNSRVLGNVSGSAHAPMELTASDLSTLLGLSTTYQPLLSLTNKDVLYSTGTSTVGQDSAFQYDAATHKLTTGLLTVSSSDGLGTAVALNQLADQAIIKTGGILALGTSSAHALSLITNGSLRLQISSAGAITLNSLTSNGFVKTTGGTGTLSVDTTTYQPALSLTSGSVLFSGGGSTVSQDNANFFWDATNHRLGIGTTSPATTLDVEGRITIGPHATGPRVQMLNPDNLASLAQVQFYPGDGTNTGTSFAVVPKGTGFSSTNKAQFSVFNTDYIADSTNYEFCVFRAAGTEFNLVSSKAGTGTARPINVQASTTGAAVSNKGITYNTDGSVTIGDGTLTVLNFSSAGLVKTTSGGVLSVDTTSYQPALSLTTTDVLFAASSSTVGQDSTFTFDSTNHILSAKRIAVTGHDSGSSINAALVLSEAADQGITKSGGTFYLGTTDSHFLQFVTNNTSRGNFDTSGNLNLSVNIIPSTTATYDLGSSSKRWNNLWVRSSATIGVAGSFGDGGTLQINAEDSYITIGGGANQVRAGLYVANSYPQYASIVTDMGYFGQSLVGYYAQQFADLSIAAGGNNTLYLGYGGDAGSPPSMTSVITINSGGSGALGFFGSAGATQQTGGSATAGGSYTSTEQGMLNRIYAALRAYGLLT